MTQLVGVDVFFLSESLPDLPKSFGSLNLVFLETRGTQIWPGETPDFHFLPLKRCRYETTRSTSHEEINDLLSTLTKNGLQWTTCQKLYSQNDEKLYSQPY
jgi:hypothetical protein